MTRAAAVGASVAGDTVVGASVAWAVVVVVLVVCDVVRVLVNEVVAVDVCDVFGVVVLADVPVVVGVVLGIVVCDDVIVAVGVEVIVHRAPSVVCEAPTTRKAANSSPTLRGVEHVSSRTVDSNLPARRICMCSSGNRLDSTIFSPMETNPECMTTLPALSSSLRRILC